MNYNDWKPSRFFVLFRSNFNIVTFLRKCLNYDKIWKNSV